MTSLESLSLPSGLPMRRGKVRDIYDVGDERLLIVATDRISAFDWVLPNAVPDKGRVLNGLSTFWFGRITSCRNHLISTEIDDSGLELPPALGAALFLGGLLVSAVLFRPLRPVGGYENPH